MNTINTVQDQLPVAPLAVWALILGIASLVFCCLPLAIPAIICGHLARSKIQQTPAALSGNGMALAGLITGYVSMVAFILACILGIIAGLALPLVIRQLDGTPRNECRELPGQFQCLSRPSL
ncbi:MAG: DUF4190 domain-containing protein [Verrucomicrobiota bacterium]